MVTKKLKGLGRGLDVLLGDKKETVKSSDNQEQTTLSVKQMQAGRYQPRTRMDETALNELAESIKKQGIMQPILVRKINSEGSAYEIIAGERRFRAAQIAGLTELPVIIKDVDDQTAAAMALIENMQREDLNPLEEAQGIHRLITEFGVTHEHASTIVGRSRSSVSNLLRLLNLAKPVQTMLVAGDIDMGHARALLAVDSATQIALANKIIARRLSVRETEKMVARAQSEANTQPAQPRTKEKSRDIIRLEEELSDLLATSVNFKMGKKGRGQLIIDFADNDVLDGILTRLRN